MSPRLLTLLVPFVVSAALAGCGGPERVDVEHVAAPVRTVAVAELPAFPVRVTVVDGDTRARVARAVVRVGRQSGRTDRRGAAALVLRSLGALPVTVWAPQYGERTLRLPFQRRRHAVVRIYRHALQWRLYGANASRTQSHGAIRLRPPFRTVWSRGLGTLIEFPAVVSDGVAYIGNNDGTITALSMRSGKRVWQRRTPYGKMASSPAIVGDELVVHGMDGVVQVLDRRNGRVRWRHRIGSPIESSPVVHGGIDYFGAWNGNVYALDLRTRRLAWIFRSGYKITSSAALAAGTLYIGDYGGRLLALDAGRGRLRWSRGVDGRIYGTPAVSAGRVFVPSSTGGSLTAFSTGGRYLWRVNTGSYVYSSPAAASGRVFFGSYNGLLYCVDARSGRVRWARSAGGPISGAAVVVDGVAYAGSFAHRIIGVDVRSGRLVLDFPHGEYVPVSGNGGRLLLHGYSRIYAVEPARRLDRGVARR